LTSRWYSWSLFRSDHFADVSLNQWMALTPPGLVKAHLNLDDEGTAQPPCTAMSRECRV